MKRPNFKRPKIQLISLLFLMAFSYLVVIAMFEQRNSTRLAQELDQTHELWAVFSEQEKLVSELRSQIKAAQDQLLSPGTASPNSSTGTITIGLRRSMANLRNLQLRLNRAELILDAHRERLNERHSLRAK